MIDETAEGNVFAALRVREADLDKHIASGQGAEQKDAAREKAREDARKKLEDEVAKKNVPPKPLPEFGSGDDFPLAQALNRLKGTAGARLARPWSSASPRRTPTEQASRSRRPQPAGVFCSRLPDLFRRRERKRSDPTLRPA